jgi:hydrogenase maturation protease
MPDRRDRKRLVIIGLGNESLSDDGVGIRVLRELKERFTGNDVGFEELSVGGLPLLDFLSEAEECVIIDAVMTGIRPPGTVYRFVQRTAGVPRTVRSSHQIDLAQVLALGTMLGAALPSTVTVYGIEAADVTTFSDACTPGVSRSIPLVAECVRQDWEQRATGFPPPDGEWEVLAVPAAA